MDLSGRVCLVTGSARRLGRAIATALAERACRLAIHYRTSEGEARDLLASIRDRGGEGEIFGADLRQAGSCETLIDDVVGRFGRIDVLINSASVLRRTPIGEVTEEDWDNLVAVNLKAPFFCSQAAGKRMKEQGSGKIVNLADVAAMSPWKGYLPYSVAKAGLVALTRGLASALAPEVQVNAIAPGTILPPEGTPLEEVERLKRKIPLERTGTPADLVGVVLFLLEGGDFITGEVILLDGGRHLT